MKRSEINRLISDAKDFFADMNFHLPPVAFRSPRDWAGKTDEAAEILDVGIGWDVTDFGLGDFLARGLLLFTLRNGRPDDSRYPKTYAEKIMIVRENQLTPTHYHWNKTEDIINRGGGNLVIRLNNATGDRRCANTPVEVVMDGVRHTVPAGGDVVLHPGESITLTPELYHSFWGEPGRGKVMVGEVSSVNDDSSDNCFYDKQLRFPVVEEDEPPIHLLVSDYADIDRYAG